MRCVEKRDCWGRPYLYDMKPYNFFTEDIKLNYKKV